ncbi:MAG: histone deacetylase [Dehalococcoidales bacterium]|nr:histone deacetylase [Dehalococcoidales bacterium]
MSVGYVYDPVYLEHDTGQHVENAQRLVAIMTCLEESGIKEQLDYIRPRAATADEVALVHSPELIACIQIMAKQGGGWLDPDTVMSAESHRAALYAAGGLIRATEVVLDRGGSVFALVRPPGHHATSNQAMGFCLFNNVAIATRYAQSRYGLERIAIIDFDVHHGNGTQDIFYEEPRVLYISAHESPLYPGTGTMEETGGGDGKGTTINIPLPAGSGDHEYLYAFEQVIVPAVTRFAPQLILVSAGYDPHWSERLAMMEVSVTGFARMTGVIKGLADELCDGRIVFALEGGYPLDSLAASVRATFDVLLGNPDIKDPLGQPQPGFKMRGFKPPDITSLITQIKQLHNLP